MKKRFSRFSKKRGSPMADFDLQITSLADILIIVLVFLLKSYSTGVTHEISVPKGIALPLIASADLGKEGLKVEISKDFVQIDGRKVAPLHHGRFLGQDLNSDLVDNGSSRALTRAIQEERAGKNPEEVKSVWVVADQRVPYRTIQSVLASAALNGYTDFNLAVIKAE